MFPEWGDAFPLWEQGTGVSLGSVSEPLRAGLREWNREWEDSATPGGRSAWPKGWLDRGEQIGRRVESETGAVVVVLGPERLGCPPECLHCGAAAEHVAADSPMATLLKRLHADYPGRTWWVRDLRSEMERRSGVTVLSLNERDVVEAAELQRYEDDPGAWMRRRYVEDVVDHAERFGTDAGRELANRWLRDGHLTKADLPENLR